MTNDKSVLAATLFIDDAKANAVLGEFPNKLRRTASEIDNIRPKGDFFGSFVGASLATDAIAKLTGLAASGGRAVLDYSANLEQVQIGFERLEGSSEKALAQVERIQKFANTTPLSFEGLLPTAQRFEEIGFKGEKLIPILTDIGNVVAGGVGRPGETLDSRLERVGLALKQTVDKGRVQMEELNQLSEAGVNGLEILTKGTGKSRAELIKLVEQGQVTGDIMLESLSKVSRAEFGDAMQKQSRTFKGALSTISDALITTAGKTFDPLFDELSGFAVKLATEVSKQEDDFFAVGNKIAEKITEGLARGIIEADYEDIFSKIRKGAEKDINERGLLRSLLFSGLLGRGIEAGLNNSLKPEAVSFNPLDISKEVNVPDNFLALSRQGNIVKGLDTTTNTIREINLALSDTPNIGDKLGAGKAVEETQKLLGIVNKFNTSEVESYLQYEKARILSENRGDNLKAIRETAEIEQLAIKEKIRLQKEFSYEQYKTLTPDERQGSKGREIALQEVAAVNQLYRQSEISRLEALTKTEEKIKQVSESIKKGKDDFLDFITSAKSTDNPLVKIFSDIDTAGSRMQKRFGDIGSEAVRMATEIEKSANSLKALETTLDNSLKAAALRGEAAELRDPFDPKKVDAQKEKLKEPFLFNSRNYLFLKQGEYEQMRLLGYDSIRGKSFEQFINDDIDKRFDYGHESQLEREQNRRDEQLKRIRDFRGDGSDRQKNALADVQIIALTSGDPLQLSNRQREEGAAARLREAERREGSQTEALNEVKKIRGLLGTVIEVLAKNGDTATKEAVIRIIDESKGAAVTEIKKPTREDTARAYQQGLRLSGGGRLSNF